MLNETMLSAQSALRRLLAASVAVVAMAGASASPIAAMPLAEQTSCQVNADFAPLVAKVGVGTVGDCLSNELSGGTSGDRFQPTTRGLLILSGAGNWTAFTDGQTTWINNGNGLATSVGGEASTGQVPATPPNAPARAPMEQPSQPATPHPAA